MNDIFTAIAVLGVIGFISSLLLSFLSKKLKVKEDLKVKEILKTLPGLNCGACGFSSCRSFAKAAVEKSDVFTGCLPGGEAVNKKVADILGLNAPKAANKTILICRCGATGGQKKQSTQYNGPRTCRAANITGGVLDCDWGCIGFGDCVNVCPAGALTLKDRKIYIDINKCISCGKCIRACPRNLFELVPLIEGLDTYYVACSNKDKVLAVKGVCSRGCIGCGICTRVQDSPYRLKDNLSSIDRTESNLKKESLEEGKNKCPTKCIFTSQENTVVKEDSK